MKYPATLICVLFILYLFWYDRKKSGSSSAALWIPLAWMFFAGTRFLAAWLGIGGGTDLDEGNPINAACFFLLIVAGVIVLFRRKIDWAALFTRNTWICLYLLYCGVSIVWSDYSFIALKRWMKDLGNPIMVLVILTEEHPYKAMGLVLRRLAYLWLPLSLLFNKYYPAWSRQYASQGGLMLSGVSGQKNGLGAICLISGIYFVWNFLLNRKEGSRLVERHSINDFILLGMAAWLLYQANSATSLGCLVVAMGLLVLSKTRFMVERPRAIIGLLMTTAFLYFLLDVTLGITDTVAETLGRDSTLTNRTNIWQAVKEFHTNPVLGAGYQSFWAGDRLQMLWARIGGNIQQSHNGYLEQYLNLGYVGVAFIGIIMLRGLLKVQRQLRVDYPAAVLSLCLIVSALLYNYTEASFYGLNNMWVLTLFAIIEVPYQNPHVAGASSPKRDM